MQCEYCQYVLFTAITQLPDTYECEHSEEGEDWYELAHATLCPGFTPLVCPRHPEKPVHVKHGCG
ncbi:hypothetical protein LCGC14_2527940, partial [marine sediment metagenome]